MRDSMLCCVGRTSAVPAFLSRAARTIPQDDIANCQNLDATHSFTGPRIVLSLLQATYLSENSRALQ